MAVWRYPDASFRMLLRAQNFTGTVVRAAAAGGRRKTAGDDYVEEEGSVDSALIKLFAGATSTHRLR